jgi:hypothetical protein
MDSGSVQLGELQRGKAKRKHHPSARIVVCGDAAMMRFHDLPHNCKAETGPSGARPPSTPEPLESVTALVWLYSGSTV